MKEVVILVTALLTITLTQGQHHGHRTRHQGYRDRYASNVVPSGPSLRGEAGLPGLPGLQGPPGLPGVCDCPEPVGGCAREGAVHMFDYYYDMAGSNIGVGSLAFVSDSKDMWLKTKEGWQKIGWLK